MLAGIQVNHDSFQRTRDESGACSGGSGSRRKHEHARKVLIWWNGEGRATRFVFYHIDKMDRRWFVDAERNISILSIQSIKWAKIEYGLTLKERSIDCDNRNFDIGDFQHVLWLFFKGASCVIWFVDVSVLVWISLAVPLDVQIWCHWKGWLGLLIPNPIPTSFPVESNSSCSRSTKMEMKYFPDGVLEIVADLIFPSKVLSKTTFTFLILGRTTTLFSKSTLMFLVR